ncbi:MAG: hypothetical protein ACOCUD_03480 [Bacillota bacterium]
MPIQLNDPIKKTVSATKVKIMRVAFNPERIMNVFLVLETDDGEVSDRKRIQLTKAQTDALISNSTSSDNLWQRIYNQIEKNYPGVVIDDTV